MSEISEPNPAPIGHNRPPIPTPDEIAEQLAIDQLSLIGRRDELAEMTDRLPAQDEIGDEWEKKLTDGIKAAQSFLKACEARRVDEKEPYLAAERAVDGFFKNVAQPIERLKDRMGALLSTYQRAKARAEQAKRDAELAEARRLQAEADEAQRKAERAARKAAEDAAAAKAAEAAREAAIKAAEDAERARKAATVKPAELSRTRTDLGVVGSLRTVWTHEIVKAASVPRSYCRPDDGLIKAAIKAHTDKAGNCDLKIPGVRIFQQSDSVVR